ncbi:hypothetical protein [Dyella psychrodurans]|uniref:hypothetical protein n=1 Tax=Dyella psychrodurans TaxID=1927960 RepID=UPI0013147B74|nr:hypothetical protein [Dyella psychrodurans]
MGNSKKSALGSNDPGLYLGGPLIHRPSQAGGFCLDPLHVVTDDLVVGKALAAIESA